MKGEKSMLKGRATIELKNVKTGELEKHVEENLVTNLFRDLMQDDPVFGSVKNYLNYKSSTFDTVIKMLSRGLLLFDGTLEEDPDKYHFPAGVDMIGRGTDEAYTGSDKTFGSFNATESDDLTALTPGKPYRQVWDFSTSQANGTIKSICLCPTLGAKIGAGKNDRDGDKDNNALEYDAQQNVQRFRYLGNGDFSRNTTYIDFDELKIYKLDAVSISDKTAAVSVYDMNYYKQDIMKGFGSSKKWDKLDAFTLNFPEEIKSIIEGGSGADYELSVHNGKFYITILPNSKKILVTDKIATCVVDCKAKKATAEVLNNPFAGTDKITKNFGNATDHEKNPVIIHNENYVALIAAKESSGYWLEPVIYIVDVKTGESKVLTNQDGTEFIPQSGYFASNKKYAGSDLCFTSNRNAEMLLDADVVYLNETGGGIFRPYPDANGKCYSAVIDLKEKKVKYINTKTTIGNSNNRFPYTGINKCGWYLTKNALMAAISVGSGSSLNITSYMNPFTLFTINNLAAPITKTDEQMMKITYELTMTE